MNLSKTAWRENLRRLLTNHRYESRSMLGLTRFLMPHHISSLYRDLEPFIAGLLADADKYNPDAKRV